MILNKYGQHFPFSWPQIDKVWWPQNVRIKIAACNLPQKNLSGPNHFSVANVTWSQNVRINVVAYDQMQNNQDRSGPKYLTTKGQNFLHWPKSAKVNWSDYFEKMFRRWSTKQPKSNFAKDFSEKWTASSAPIDAKLQRPNDSNIVSKRLATRDPPSKLSKSNGPKMTDLSPFVDPIPAPKLQRSNGPNLFSRKMLPKTTKAEWAQICSRKMESMFPSMDAKKFKGQMVVALFKKE